MKGEGSGAGDERGRARGDQRERAGQGDQREQAAGDQRMPLRP